MRPKFIKGDISIDDRGQVSFVNDFNFKNVKRFYMVSNHRQGFIRAWHGHKKEAKYVFVPKGSVLVGVVKLGSKEPKAFVLSEREPAVLYIPPGYANGVKTLTADAQVIFFSTSTTKQSLDDDIRFPARHWNIWGELER